MSKQSFLRHLLLAVAASVGLTGCTVSSTDTPGLSGPSELALAFDITATPDTVTWDGGSQTAVIVSAYDHTGGPKSNVTFKLDKLFRGTPTDEFGSLSSKTLITGSDGRATAFYTAPPPLPTDADVPTCGGVAGECVMIAATPVGNDAFASKTETVTVRLVPMGFVPLPGGTPVAAFTFNPGAPAANEPVAFDASASCADAASACSSAGLTYHWDFGDGHVGSGRTTFHVYGLARTHNVVLTVTNARGRQATLSKSITVGAGADPSAAFVYSPKPVVINSAVNFDASASRPASGHLITGYRWNWGDGTTSSESSSPLATHTFTAQGAYTVVLTTIDESGQTGTKSEVIDVGLGNPTANFTFIKNGLSVDFDGRSSTAVGAATIASYAWNLGDAATTTGTTVTHAYGGAGSYNVTLTVTDSTGKVGVVSKSVTVP